MKKVVINGDFAASYGALSAEVKFIAAYPITPQTLVVEKLSELVSDGELKASFVKVESEHSAMAACMGAEAAGVRSFTATSSQGLLLMSEVLHWSARARLPIVMSNVNRAVGPGWSIWADDTDSISQRDTGWMQVYVENNQEVYDAILMGYKISEDPGILLPTMVNLDAFFLSHTSEIVEMIDTEDVRKFLPPYDPKYKLDVNDPHAFGALTSPEYYYEFTVKIHKAMIKAKRKIQEVGKEFGDKFGRYYDMTEAYKTEDADIILVTHGTIAGTAKETVDRLRAEGKKVGNLKIRYLRPFPDEQVYEHLKNAKKIVVVDRSISYGKEGAFYSETKASLFDYNLFVPTYGMIAGLGGRDVSIQTIREIVKTAEDNEPNKIFFIGEKK
ncbi:pyruvate ferredoxin oxidoreductase [bacterium]|nr:pyruvate ferredoxin oxidoreductase [bacterium]